MRLVSGVSGSKLAVRGRRVRIRGKAESILDVVEVDVSGDGWGGVRRSCLKARRAYLSKSAVRQHHPAFFRTPCSRWADSNC